MPRVRRDAHKAVADAEATRAATVQRVQSEVLLVCVPGVTDACACVRAWGGSCRRLDGNGARGVLVPLRAAGRCLLSLVLRRVRADVFSRRRLAQEQGHRACLGDWSVHRGLHPGVGPWASLVVRRSAYASPHPFAASCSCLSIAELPARRAKSRVLSRPRSAHRPNLRGIRVLSLRPRGRRVRWRDGVRAPGAAWTHEIRPARHRPAWGRVGQRGHGSSTC